MKKMMIFAVLAAAVVSLSGAEKFFEMDCIYRILFGAGEDFEIYEGRELYYFVPEDVRSAVMWYIVSGLLKNN